MAWPIIILVNGPPGAGKDTVAEVIKRSHFNVQSLKFADPIRDVVRVMFPGISSYSQFEDFKATPLEDFGTGRDFMIQFSEEFVKPRLGSTWFGYAAAQRLLDQSPASDVYVITDCGFREEAAAFIEAIRSEIDPFVALWRIQRPWHSFENDSRQWVTNIGEDMHAVLMNSGTLPQFHELIDAEFDSVRAQRKAKEAKT